MYYVVAQLIPFHMAFDYVTSISSKIRNCYWEGVFFQTTSIREEFSYILQDVQRADEFMQWINRYGTSDTIAGVNFVGWGVTHCSVSFILINTLLLNPVFNVISLFESIGVGKRK